MPIISKDIWITAEGQQMEIRTMASSHLLAAIHYIERRRFMNVTDTAMREAVNPDMDFNSPTIQYYLEWPIQYETLVNEANKRNLLYRPVNQGVIIREVGNEKKLDPPQRPRLKGKDKK